MINITKSIKSKNKLFIILFIISIVAIYLINYLIPKNLVVLSGEYIFSFDYEDHFFEVLSNFNILDINSYLTNTGGDVFYPYSWFYNFALIGLSRIGEILLLHPFYFYLLVNIFAQAISLWILFRVIFNRRPNFIGYVLGSLIFIFSGYKVFYVVAGSWYGLSHALINIYIATMLYILTKQITTFKKLFILSFMFFINFILILAYSINFVPILFYSTFLVLMFYVNKRNIKTTTKFILLFLFFLGILVTPLLINSIYKNNLDASKLDRGYSRITNNDEFIQSLTLRQNYMVDTNSLNSLIVIIFVSMITVLFVSFLANRYISIKAN